ncbi:MAG: 3-phosphoshikimate 1-carboxyvinyltransferase, partial [Candidatus Omnitrophica bacterium]|nr:3-phosphoshikimate 1-carboxyvinyltransferase [Candidatus Omnitrophota bacterium]
NNSEIVLKNINLTPSRAGLLKVLKRMGANIKVINKKNTFEPYGDLIVKSSKLLATTINKSEIPSMIDEIPILCVAASHAKGKTSILGVKELKVKETDRINSTIYNLSKAGVKISAEKYIEKGNEDWLINIEECKHFKNAKFKSFSDHRTAMSAIVLGSTIGKKTILNETDCIKKSFPNFIALYNSLYKK